MTSLKRSKKRQRLIKNISAYSVLALVGIMMIAPTFIMVTQIGRAHV